MTLNAQPYRSDSMPRGLQRLQPWARAAQRAMVSGSIASILSTAVLATLGKRQAGSFVAPTNATSHWLWGDRAYGEQAASLRHTGVGYTTHHASAMFWAVIYERLLQRRPHPSAAQIVSDAALVTGLAAAVDYGITPQRLRPGFEKRLPRASVTAAFVALGLGLAVGALLNRRQERRNDRLMQL